MRKWVGAVLFWTIIVLSFVYVTKGLAVNATEAVNPEAQPMLIYGKSLNGIAKFSAEPKAVQGTGQVYNGSCTIHQVTLYSDTAGDMLGVYNSGTGLGVNYLEFELGISANTSSATIDMHGVRFEKGIFIVVSDATNSVVGTVFDY